MHECPRCGEDCPCPAGEESKAGHPALFHCEHWKDCDFDVDVDDDEGDWGEEWESEDDFDEHFPDGRKV